MTADLFDRAKANADIVAVYGGKLHGAGQKRRGICPLCRHGDKKKAGFAFEIDVRKKTFRAYCCDAAGGSVIDLEHLMHSRGSETIIDAAKRLAGEAFPGDRPMAQAVPPVAQAVVVPEGPSRSELFAARIWQESQPAGRSLVQRYLLSRSIHGLVLIEALKHMQFHPNVFYAKDEDGAVRSFPGLIQQVVVVGPGGLMTPTGGINVTYLARDGSGKAPVWDGEKAKKMWGPQHLDGRMGGVWLTAPDAGGPLMVAEGNENALSMAILHGEPCRACATLSLDRLQGGYVKDQYGRFDPDLPKADAERPPFTWPQVGEDRVIIGLDHDMAPKAVKVRKRHGGTGERILTASERARLCGTLAKAAWHRAGWRNVKCVAPPIGEDFNDKQRQSALQGGL